MVKCMICGKELKQISWGHLYKIHGITFDEYKSRFPSAKTGMEGENNPFYGKRHTEETKKTLSDTIKEQYDEGREPWNKGMTGYTYEELYGEEKARELKKERTQNAKNLWQRGDTKFNRTGIEPFNNGEPIEEWMSEEGLKKFKKTWFKKGHEPFNKNLPMELWMTPEGRISYTESRKLLKKKFKGDNNPFYGKKHTEETIRKMLKSLRTNPNKAEKSFQRFLDRICPNEYKYNSGWFILANKVPDFVDINGKKKIIELAGEKWHNKSYETERRELFAKYGFDCLVVWFEDDFIRKTETVKEKILEFTYGGD